jgi:hypothetical protein
LRNKKYVNYIYYLTFHRWLQTKPVILLFNKQDLLAEKIKNGSRVEDYLREYYGEDDIPLVEPGKRIMYK